MFGKLSGLRRSVWTVAAALCVVATSASAQMAVTYTDNGKSLFRFEAPDFWSVRSGGSRELTAPGTEDTRIVSRVIGLQPVTEPKLWVGFLSPAQVGTIAQGETYLQDIGPFLVKDAIVEERKTVRIGGLPAASYAGQGLRDGKTVQFTALLIDLPNGRMAISIVVMEPGIDPMIVDDVNAIFTSFRAVR